MSWLSRNRLRSTMTIDADGKVKYRKKADAETEMRIALPIA